MAETTEKRMKRIEREQRQQARLLKEQNRKPWKNYVLYMVYLIVVLTIIYIVDEIASAMNGSMQPLMIFDFFKVPGMLKVPEPVEGPILIEIQLNV